jgi:hypothetical protein
VIIVSDDKLVRRNLAALGEGELIDDATARVIASQWSDGQWAALYSLSSCGAIDERTTGEIEAEIRHDATSPEQYPALEALLAYVEHHGTRGAVDGWSDLWVK